MKIIIHVQVIKRLNNHHGAKQNKQTEASNSCQNQHVIPINSEEEECLQTFNASERSCQHGGCISDRSGDAEALQTTSGTAAAIINSNLNATLDESSRDAPRPPQQQLSTRAGDNTTGPTPSGGSTSASSSEQTRRSLTLKAVVLYFVLLVRDVLTFFVRGGLMAMMFAMDQTLSVVILVFGVLLGPTVSKVLEFPLRGGLWLYQLLTWIVYFMFELLIYLPWQLLLVYVAVVSFLLFLMPSPVYEAVKNLANGLFKALHNFIGFYRFSYRALSGDDPVI